MEPAAKKQKLYVTWNNAARHALIKKRIQLDHLFTGKNANSNEAWKKVAEELEGTKDSKNCKSQWNAIVKKYKKFFSYKTGEGTGEEAVAEEAKDWEFFEVMHEYASKKDNYHPPFLMDSTDGEISMRSPTEDSLSSPASQATSARLSCSPGPSRRSISPGRRSKSGSRMSKEPNRDERLHKLEEHICKRDRKLSKRIGSLLSVFGQMVRTDYPHINVDPLLISSESDSD